MPLVVDLLLGLELLLAEDHPAQVLELAEQGVQAVEGVVLAQHLEQPGQFREAVVHRVLQLGVDLRQTEVVLEVEQLVHPHQQGEAPPLDRVEILLGVQVGLALVVVPGEDLVHAGEAQVPADALRQPVLVVDKGPVDSHLVEHLVGQVFAQVALVQGDPEGEDALDEADDQVARLHVRLLAQEVDERILALVDLVEFGGHVAQLALGADLVEEHRHELGELLGQVVDRADGVVEQLGDVALEQVGVAHAGAGQAQIDDQRREQGGAPLGLLLDQAQPDADVGQVGRVGDGLPVLVHAAHVRVLEAEAHRLPEKGLDQARVAALEHLVADHLDALQAGVRVAADVGLEQVEGGVEEQLDLLEALLADELHQRTVDLAQGLLVDERQPPGLHDAEQEEQLAVLDEVGVRLAGRVGGDHLRGDLLVQADDLHVVGQGEHQVQGGVVVALLRHLVQGLQTPADMVVGDAHQEVLAVPLAAVVAALLLEPGQRVLLAEPVLVVAPQDGAHQPAQ